MKKENKKIFLINVAVLIAVIVFITITLFSCTFFKKKSNENTKEQQEYTKEIIEIFKQNYLYSDQIDDDKITMGLINGILSQDKYGRLNINNKLVIDDNKDEKLIGIQTKRTKFGKYFIKGYINKNKPPKSKLKAINGVETNSDDQDKNMLKIGDELLYFQVGDKKEYIEGLSIDDYISLVKPTQEQINNGAFVLPDKFQLAVKRLNGEYKGEYESKYDFLIFEVEKQIINHSETEESFSLSEKTFVLRLESFSAFNSNVEEFIKKAYYIANSESHDGVDYSKVKNVVIDLRNNGGGDLEILALIVKVLYGDYNANNLIQFKSKNKTTLYSINQLVNNLKKRSEFNELLDKYPITYNAVLNKYSNNSLTKKRTDIGIYILSNNMTASASEAFIGISKNKNINPNFKAQIGQKTYGKGVAQSVIPYKNFKYKGQDSYLVITTSKYSILNNENKFENIDGKGYTPEHIIEVTPKTERVYNKIENDAFYKKLKEIISS